MDWLAILPPIILFAIKIGEYFLEGRDREKTIVEKQAEFDRVLAEGDVGLINRYIDDLDLILRRESATRRPQ